MERSRPWIVGDVLLTRDGRRVGNGVILHVEHRPFAGEVQTLYKCVTDFGNTMNLTTGELDELFHPPSDERVTTFDRWFLDKTELLNSMYVDMKFGE